MPVGSFPLTLDPDFDPLSYPLVAGLRIYDTSSRWFLCCPNVRLGEQCCVLALDGFPNIWLEQPL
jgi:hypothetical protein